MTRIALAAAILAATAGMASADVEVFNGNTTGGPTYNRTLAGNPPTSLSAVGTSVRYQVIPVYTDFSASVLFTINNNVPAAFDTFMSLYAGSFNAATPLANILVASDDVLGSNPQFSRSLTGGLQYFVVVTGFDNADFGTYTLTMSSSTADITIGLVPAPGSLALLGLAGIAAGRRRR
ncbi:MAG: PEP-CTERM sorting domain-containing protein [Planctomycetota bacterium]|nr:PEP-CTERM sorting domain-containing protein [Planctomycetota bacterium]